MPIHRDLYERERTLVDATGKAIDNSNPLAVTVAGGGGPATIADGADQAEGAKADTAATTDTGTFSLIALFKRLLQKFTTQFPAALTGSGNLKVSLQESNASQAVTLATLPALTAGSALIGKVDVNKVPGTISTNNSSTTPLTSGSVFTGPADDVSGFAAIMVNVFADQAGTLAPQFSSNGTNWDFVGSHAIAANVGQMFVFRPGTQFFRLVYTNGGTNQGAFRLQTILHLDDIDIATVQALGAGLPNPTTEQVGADLMVQTGGGTTWAPAKADSSNRLTFSTDDGSLVSLGATTDAAATADAGTFSLIALFKRLLQKFTTQFPSALVSNRLDVNLGAAPATVTVQGGAAAGTAIAGNPVLMGGSDTSGNSRFFALSAAGGLGGGGLNGASAVTDFRVNGADTDATSNSVNSLVVRADAYDFNAASWDRHRNNVDATLLASAARTTTQGPTTLTTYNLGAIIFVLDMTTVGTGSVTLTINEVDPASGKSILLLSGAAVVTNSTNVYIIDPMLTAAANSIAKARTPRTLSWTVTANNANSATYSLGAMELVP
jgi:hypothetical protein